MKQRKPVALKRKLKDVFEGTIDGQKMMFDARANTLTKLGEYTGSPKAFAEAHGMRIVSRAKAPKPVVRMLKKLWGIAMLEKIKATGKK